MSLRIAFTGTGHISNAHAQAARNQADVKLAAVVNHRPESREAYAGKFGISRQYDDVESLLADGGIDALVVSTPNFLHAPQTIAALNAGIHVMVEKPMAMNAEEAGRMLAASRASSAKLMVAHCWRFDEEVHWLKRQIDEKPPGSDLAHQGVWRARELGDPTVGLSKRATLGAARWRTWAFMPSIPPVICWAIRNRKAFTPGSRPITPTTMSMTAARSGSIGIMT